MTASLSSIGASRRARCRALGLERKVGEVVKTRRYYVLLAGILGLAVAVLPAIASSETSPTIEARNTPGSIYEHHEWAPTQVSVGSGGVVTLSNPTAVPHGVEWIGAAKPTCSSGVPVGSTPAAAGIDWNGTCTFTQPGTYIFYCTVHGPEMTGRVVVSADGTTTTTTPTTPTTGTTTTTGTVPKVQEEAPAGPPLTGAPALRSVGHGTSITGSLQISPAGVGDRLEVDLVADAAVLAKSRHGKRVTVGRYVHNSVKAGRQSFTVKLNAKARAALKRRHRLVLTVKLVLTPGYGEPTTRTRSLVVHG
jgi:plastocyanin